MKRVVAIWLLAGLGALAHAESGVVVRATELKDKPFADANTLATLSENSSVNITGRQGAWMQVNASSKNGWVKMLSVRTGSGEVGSGQQVGGLLAGASVFKSGSSGSTTTTGVKGLSEEEIRNANPNPNELAKLDRLGTNADDASKFAKQAKLASAKVEYLPVPRNVKSTRSQGDN